jgi:hypothetical protein
MDGFGNDVCVGRACCVGIRFDMYDFFSCMAADTMRACVLLDMRQT